jgi:hypothetical protein
MEASSLMVCPWRAQGKLQGMTRVGQIHIDLPSTADLYVAAETTATAHWRPLAELPGRD